MVKMRGFHVIAGILEEKMHDLWVECFFFFFLSLLVIFALNSRVNTVPEHPDCSTRAH